MAPFDQSAVVPGFDTSFSTNGATGSASGPKKEHEPCRDIPHLKEEAKYGDSETRNELAAQLSSRPDSGPNGADLGSRIRFRPSPPALPRMSTPHALQEWEGHVVEIGDGEFVARLLDVTAEQSHESEEATIPVAEISETDAAKMTVGSIFRWVIGYERSVEGTHKRVSQIVFRDLPRMTEGDIRHGDEWAGKVASALNP